MSLFIVVDLLAGMQRCWLQCSRRSVFRYDVFWLPIEHGDTCLK